MPEREEYLVNRIKKLEADLEKAEAGAREIEMLVDGLMIQLAKEYGVKVQGGYQMKMPVFDAKALVEKYAVSVEKDDFQYEVRAIRREV